MRKIKLLLIPLLVLGLVGCSNHKPVQSIQSNQSTHSVASYHQDNTNPKSTTQLTIDKKTKAEITGLITNYITDLVNNDVEKLKGITKEQARKELSSDKFKKRVYTSLDRVVKISILPVSESKDEFSVIAVFQATLVNQKEPTSAQLNVSVQKVNGDYYITSVSRTV